MARYAGYVSAILLILLIFQVVIVVPQTVNEHDSNMPQMPLADSTTEVEQAMKGVHLVETREGGREWELWADRAVAFKNKNLWRMNEVKVVFFANNGVHFTVTGERGEIETGSKNMRVDGNVVTRTSNGFWFKTETVIYDSVTRILKSPTPVSMQGPKDEKGSALTLRADSMNADLTNSLMEVNQNVRAEKNIDRDRTVIIRSDKSQFSGKERLARFLGNVVIDMDTMRITGPEAEFQYDPKREIVESINVKGGARVSDTEKYATSQNLQVHFEQDKFVFRGHPRVVQDGDELRGEEIVFLDGGKRVLVQRARAKVDERTLEKAN